ncbi:hypothetical protein C4E44_08100 [Pseudomonas sp. MWU12-2312b]|uniref:hypothetical protein n=1 Tax=Pseudomonas moorei TaxID=395599 RepID=UPI000D458428|nr:hypothetical protein [Pseudomonas moorei]PPA04607.1 hypothetical protein C4E44_08100 [Pseudomonas sp. MWU12-2312b]
MSVININEFPAFFRAYNWSNANHKTRGYPGDKYPAFPWIKSLEDRGDWLVKLTAMTSAPTDYVRELLAWGAGKNDPRMRFEAGLGNVSLLGIFAPVVANIGDPKTAITAALQIPGCGLTYASKLLRFLRPDIHASLDGRIREAMLKVGLLSKIYDGNENSMVRGYVAFQFFCAELVAQLDAAKIDRPECSLPAALTQTGWRVADVEMAMFAWADRASPGADAESQVAILD